VAVSGGVYYFSVGGEAVAAFQFPVLAVGAFTALTLRVWKAGAHEWVPLPVGQQGVFHG
jgi:hypothetical protein